MSETLSKLRTDILKYRTERNALAVNVLNTLVSESTRDEKEPTEEKVQKSITKFIKNLDVTLKYKPTDEKLRTERHLVKSYQLQEACDLDFTLIVDSLLAANADKVESCKEKPQNIGWFVGQTMKATGGKSNPTDVKAYIEQKLLSA